LTAALVDGYRSGLTSPRFTRQQAFDAVVAIELDNLADGIQRRLAMPSTRLAAVAEALALCARGDPDPAVRALIAGPPEAAAPHVADATASLIHPDHRTGFACTGFSLPGGWTRRWPAPARAQPGCRPVQLEHRQHAVPDRRNRGPSGLAPLCRLRHSGPDLSGRDKRTE
jgi:hypothetical protein